jgi:nitrogen-specific signal transduction histidine kinase
MVVGEGNGIGLWVVDNIMKAHRGELEIFPTTADKFTQVRLLFPIHK